MIRHLTSAALAATLACSAAALSAGAARAETFTLLVTPSTVAWGNYDPAGKPALTVKSGDTVMAHTLLTNNPTGLKANGVPDDQIEASLKDVYANVPAAARGPGGHILTGPIAVEGAEPGDTLEVRILKIDLAIPYAYNGFGPGTGVLRDDFPYRRTKIIPLDREKMVARFGPNITIPLHPFFGSMGVAPPPELGKWDSTPPTVIGGNMDNKELVAGTTLFLPVFVKGGLFEVGDGHAGQGNGEVDVTAMETSLVGTFQFILHKGEKAPYPRAETPTHYIAMGFDDDLAIATQKAVRNMVEFLVTQKGLSRDDAYALTSVAGDVDVTELVDRNKGVHVMMPKAIFAK
ncbi:acetamidase/formamidase family protein [Phenylobacterium sp.]|uniref:acetamidase/formamidase family protein n=1 Tax=Phenylobacterium sp. TaxID=1871053 RepID=UPI0011FCB171|nr:acetamidase/formamidase family protein [Phenylobacterium sp.]THD57624.1 MAG: acetamidase [Phenylobacterium sp.]